MKINLNKLKVGDLIRMPIEKLTYKDNIRIDVETKNSPLGPLMSDIRQNGLLQSIGVALDTNEDKIILVHGNRRTEACRKLGHKNIDARIVGINLTDQEFSSLNLSENFHRTDNTVMEMGREFKKQADEFNMSISEIAARNSIPANTVQIALNLYREVPEEFMKDIEFSKPGVPKKGKISSGAAASIIAGRNFTAGDRFKLFEKTRRDELPSHKIKLISQMKDAGMSVDDAVKKAKNYTQKGCTIVVSIDGLDKIEKDVRFNSWADYVRKVLRGEIKPDTSIF